MTAVVQRSTVVSGNTFQEFGRSPNYRTLGDPTAGMCFGTWQRLFTGVGKRREGMGFFFEASNVYCQNNGVRFYFQWPKSENLC